MASSSTIATATTITVNKQRTIVGGGLADYFAILGIGDEITFMANSKTNNLGIASNNDDERLKYLEEEECVLVERFYREIVDITLITVNEEIEIKETPVTRDSSFALDDDSKLSESYVSVDNRGIHKLNLNGSFILGRSSSSLHQNIPTSNIPKMAEERNKVMVLRGAGLTIRSSYLPKEVAGYHMVWTTMPLSHSFHQVSSTLVGETSDPSLCNTHILPVEEGKPSEPNMYPYPFSPKKTRSKVLLDEIHKQENHDMDISTSREFDISIDKSADSSILRENFWGKGEAYDSDLNLFMGLRSIVLSKVEGGLSKSNTLAQDHSFDDPTPKVQNSLAGTKTKTGIGGLVDKMKFKSRSMPMPIKTCHESEESKCPNKYYIGFRRRGADENDRPAIADAVLMYVRVHSSTIIHQQTNVQSENNTIVPKNDHSLDHSDIINGTPSKTDHRPVAVLKRSIIHGAGVATRVALSSANKILGAPSKQHQQQYSSNDTTGVEHFTFSSEHLPNDTSNAFGNVEMIETVLLSDCLTLPQGFDEWVVPDTIETINLPVSTQTDQPPASTSTGVVADTRQRIGKKVVIVQNISDTSVDDAIETCVDGSSLSQAFSGSPTSRQVLYISESDVNSPSKRSVFPGTRSLNDVEYHSFLPVLLNHDQIPDHGSVSDRRYEYFPIVALRRQRCGNDERFHEDSAITDLSVSFMDQLGNFVLPEENVDDDDDENEDCFHGYLKMTRWSTKRWQNGNNALTKAAIVPAIVVRKNVPMGFADVPIVTRVLDRFPRKDYKGLPLPAEELPMFCYPRRGCNLLRANGVDCPQPLIYGFVVKNERGDSIFVSCLSFMEPLTKDKLKNLDRISERRRKTSIAHRIFWEQQQSPDNNQSSVTDSLFTGFDQLVTYECKTICLTSRFPFWTAFRRYLSHLHVLSVSSSDIPIERHISHLILTVPVPKPGGQCILVPLPALAGPMVLTMPPLKDLPLVDLTFRTLFSCLDVPTVVTVVVGLLALERKVILMSTYPSLVLDVCELLRSLIFPFDLCAPYVPRLTQPFMSCLEFPGSIFVGIHDDQSSDGLASLIRKNIPDDTLLVDLDTGDIDCKGDRFSTLSSCWDVIPADQRGILCQELEILCRDAELIPGQEALGQELETTFETIVPHILNDDPNNTLDDRAVRDCFLRFFCSILGGYDRYLVVPDMDYLISGTDWFNTDGFLAAANPLCRDYLRSFVATQMFQAFIQRRTEASDLRCLLFDECISEFHSSKACYGRLSKEVTYTNSYHRSTPIYNLLIDQCAAEPSELTVQESEDGSSGETSLLTSYTEDFMINNSGDLVTVPLRKYLPNGQMYLYCIDGHSSFPQNLDSKFFYPKEPDRLCTDIGQTHVTTLTRSERELDDSKRKRRHVTSYRNSGQKQRRCLLQLPKLMPDLSNDQQTKYLLRALGAVRLLRSRQRIIPDEAGYRSLMIACGRSQSDRRLEVVKLFGLLRSDGNFPSAVTLGQYTKAIAEGFSKRSSGKPGNHTTDSFSSMWTDLSNKADKIAFMEKNSKNIINILDGNAIELEQSGDSWRYERAGFKDAPDISIEMNDSKQDITAPVGTKQRSYTKRGHHKSWFPVSCSSSFVPWWGVHTYDKNRSCLNDFKFIAIWSRATACEKCSYTLLDEEVQSGWQSQDDDAEPVDTVGCPRCSHRVYPLLGYKEMMIDSKTKELEDMPLRHEEGPMPPQLKRTIAHHEDNDHSVCFVSYTSPSKLRFKLEKYVEEYGEDILERERLRRLDPTVFYNFFWYCARFSLPLPLAVDLKMDTSDEQDDCKHMCSNYCAMASWEKCVAEEGCRSAALCIVQLFDGAHGTGSSQDQGVESDNHIVVEPEDTLLSDLLMSDDFPLLANFSLQTYAQSDWDHPDLSEILFRLVEACDKRDLLPVVECVLQRNLDREERFGPCKDGSTVLDCYKTLLYLTRYQCTSAFHRFFLPVVKPCKGWHFWCPNGTVSTFDRMFRDAIDRLRSSGRLYTKIHEPSDQALGFRSIFGHII